MTDYDFDKEYREAMTEFRQEQRQLDRFFRGLILLGWVGVIAVIAIGVAYG